MTFSPSRAMLLKKLPTRESIRNSWLHRCFGDTVLREDLWVPTRHSMALGMALGWLVGLWPVFGLQIALSLFLGFFARCHLPTAVLGTFITNPLTTPAILLLQYELGTWLSGMPMIPHIQEVSPLVKHGIPLVLGAGVSSVAAALIAYLGIWTLWSVLGKKALDRGVA